MKQDYNRGPYIEHDPASNLDYGIDWTDWLDAGDAVAESSWTAPAAITLDMAQLAGSLASVYATGGVPGSEYKLTNRITTTAGRVAVRSITLVCKKL